MLKNIEKHRKEKVEKVEKVTRSVLIRRDQNDFLNREGLNLSSLVRELIDLIFKGEKNGK